MQKKRKSTAEKSSAVGNLAKLREVAEFVAHIDNNGYTSHDVQCAIDKARAALSAPPRNCDIGTPEEQQARHCAWCRKSGIDGDNKVNCIDPDVYCDLCALRWAQMPYEEGGAK